MTLSIGKYLRQTRESRNMTLDQLAQATRVRLIYLRALESDEPSLLPSVVQARGYLRLIANALEIDSKPLLNAYPDKPVILPEADAATPLAESETIAAPSSEVTGTIPPIDESPVESAVESQPFALPEALSIEPPPPPEGSSSFIFAHLGRQLRSQRETLGISLEDAERFTRLKARYLQAIEEGRLEHLPSLVQGRGMLRNYSHFLNLNSDLILDQFAEGLQQRRVEFSAPVAPVAADNTPQKTRKRLPSTPIWRRYITPDLLIGAMLFLVLAVFVVWGTARVSDLQGLDSSPTAPSISELLINDTAQPGLIETTPPPQNFAATGDIDAPRQNIAPESGEVLP
ncbi:MAG: helix-turn-helix domain-containing protein, partial [Chloroflexota bacterium]